MSDEAKKHDSGKRKLSLIHPSTMSLLCQGYKSKNLAESICNLSRAAHAGSVEGIIEFLRVAQTNVVNHLGGNTALAINELARAMEYGEKKYGRNNWKKGMEWSRLIDAALRHGLAGAMGENIDEESGNTHVAHMLASIHMLLGNIALNVGTNDIC